MKNELTVRLNEQIKKSNITQAALAKLTGIPQPQISMKLTGVRRNWTLDQAMSICLAIGFNPHQLVSRHPVETPGKLFSFDSEISQIREVLRQLETTASFLKEGEPELASRRLTTAMADLLRCHMELDDRIQAWSRLAKLAQEPT
jgi:transcriptional regulator with XRE-family HTH domain